MLTHTIVAWSFTANYSLQLRVQQFSLLLNGNKLRVYINVFSIAAYFCERLT